MNNCIQNLRSGDKIYVINHDHYHIQSHLLIRGPIKVRWLDFEVFEFRNEAGVIWHGGVKFLSRMIIRIVKAPK